MSDKFASDAEIEASIRTFNSSLKSMTEAFAMVVRDAFSAFAIATADMTIATNFWLGYQMGAVGNARDWDRPDAWHRGYIRGRLAWYKRYFIKRTVRISKSS